MLSILQYQLLGNTLECYAWVTAIIIAVFIFRTYVSKLINLILYRLFRRITVENRIQDFQRLVLRPMEWLLMFIVIVAALEALHFPAEWNKTIFDVSIEKIINSIKWTILLFAFTKVLLRIVDFIGAILLERAALTESKSDDQLVPFVKDSIKVVIYVLFLLILLGVVLDFNITSLLAGLGIGGLAIAFAAQESIKDLFGSVTIFLDKPFMVGDTVKVGDVEGNVEKVGFRSTRIRTYDQSFVTMPNKKMIENAVDNLTKRRLRRVRMIIGLSFSTSATQLHKIISDIQALLQKRNLDENMVVALEGFGESSINLLVIYYTPFDPVENFFQLRSDINFEIMDVVAANGASFAFPVREIKMETPVSSPSMKHE
jgi:MscS family membrane protein